MFFLLKNRKLFSGGFCLSVREQVFPLGKVARDFGFFALYSCYFVDLQTIKKLSKTYSLRVELINKIFHTFYNKNFIQQ